MQGQAPCTKLLQNCVISVEHNVTPRISPHYIARTRTQSNSTITPWTETLHNSFSRIYMKIPLHKQLDRLGTLEKKMSGLPKAQLGSLLFVPDDPGGPARGLPRALPFHLWGSRLGPKKDEQDEQLFFVCWFLGLILISLLFFFSFLFETNLRVFIVYLTYLTNCKLEYCWSIDTVASCKGSQVFTGKRVTPTLWANSHNFGIAFGSVMFIFPRPFALLFMIKDDKMNVPGVRLSFEVSNKFNLFQDLCIIQLLKGYSWWTSGMMKHDETWWYKPASCRSIFSDLLKGWCNRQ